MSLLMRHTIALISALGFLINDAGCEIADKEWWETTLVYQIWPRGFQDSDGNGEGDLKGIINHLDYLKDLKIETIWLNPIYPSPLTDAGYDVSNYTDIHPLFGDLDDFDNLIREAHIRGLRVILDAVPNHSSDQHKWFQLSVQNIEPYNDYYIWADSSDNKIRPNNWVSTYSDEKGSAWTWHDERQQWYYHKFHESQPDLNLRNNRVIEEFMSIFDFWLEKGVDGFRIGAVPYFYEDESLRDEPAANVYTSGLPESAQLLYVFREYIDDWVRGHNATSKLLIAESYDSDDNLMTYYGNDTHRGIQPFNFKFITQVRNNSDASQIKQVLEEWLKLLPQNASTNWMLSNHDNPRVASRIGLNRVDGLHMLTLLLPGQAYTYYGEEIAMLNTKISWKRTLDPRGCSMGEVRYEVGSRDPARTPMQWNSGISAGFSTNQTTYLPVHPDYRSRNVEAQNESKEQSNIKTYIKLAELRKQRVFTHGDCQFESLNNNRVLVMKRFLENYPEYIIIINLGIRKEKVNLSSIYSDLSETLEIIVASSNAVHVRGTIPRDNISLTANAALVLKSKEKDGVGGNTTVKPESGTTKKPNDAARYTSAMQLVAAATLIAILSY